MRPDQAKRTKATEILPFFGVPGHHQTHEQTRGNVRCTRGALLRPPGAGRFLHLNYPPALENFPSAGRHRRCHPHQPAHRAGVRQAPEQYFWVHKRFKARGPGYPEVY